LDKVLKSVLVTSPNNDEGKSLVASNIAITIANSGAKVILVDANFINPKLNKLFNLHSSPSLAHYLLKKKNLDNIIRTTQIPNLSIITGVELIQNAGTIMNSSRMKEFIKIINNRFDFIIYDSASLSTLKESITIAKFVDQTILIARANKTQLSSINEAVSILKNNGIDNFGVVLNDTES
jgi:capsular exopolysaccharide synthesis family protein